jgi:DNA adenine methylase
MARASKAAAPVAEQLQLGTDPRATPFLKWVGGKRKLVPTIRGLMPPKYKRYLEPFIGGGALFFDVAPDAQIHGPAYLGDVNEELLSTYYGVQHHVTAVVKLLERHKVRHAQHGKDYYLDVRAQDTKDWNEDTIAARMIYLNKTCFNGLYRVSKKGKFNVPMGRYEDPAILDARGLQACSDILNRSMAEFHHCDFQKVHGIAEKGDFVYFDPPYVETSKTANFKGYAAGGFDEEQQTKLAELFQELTDDGVYCILSNSDTPLVRKLYADHPIREVSRTGSVSSKPSKRQRVGELLIRGWAW